MCTTNQMQNNSYVSIGQTRIHTQIVPYLYGLPRNFSNPFMDTRGCSGSSWSRWLELAHTRRALDLLVLHLGENDLPTDHLWGLASPVSVRWYSPLSRRLRDFFGQLGQRKLGCSLGLDGGKWGFKPG